MNAEPEPEILNIEQAAALLGVSVKTFNKVLHAQALPARKIGREWKFSRRHLIDWVGSGLSTEFYREGSGEADTVTPAAPPAVTPAAPPAAVPAPGPDRLESAGDGTATNGVARGAAAERRPEERRAEERRTTGWRLQLD
jgi:excisionase family DNA binding protein